MWAAKALAELCRYVGLLLAYVKGNTISYLLTNIMYLLSIQPKRGLFYANLQ